MMTWPGSATGRSASKLGRRGVHVAVFDPRPELHRLPRAVVHDGEVAHRLAQAGVLDAVQAITDAAGARTPVAGSPGESVAELNTPERAWQLA